MNAGVSLLAASAAAGVLALSGTAQLAHRTDRSHALRELRLPAPLTASAFATAWALAELTVAVGLLAAPAPLVRVAALAAVAMFVAFLVVVSRAASFAEPVRCPCFGRLDSRPIGPETVVRSWGFLGLGVLALIASEHGPVVAQATSLSASDSGIAQLGLLLIALVLVLHLMNRVRERPRAATPGGTPAADSSSQLTEAYLPDLFGARHDVRQLVGSERSILLFLDPGCGSCSDLADQVPTWRQDLDDHGVVLRVVTPVPPAQALAHYPQLGAYLHHDENQTLADQLGLDSLPAAVYVGRDGTASVADGPAQGAHAIAVLVKNALSDASTEAPSRPRGSG